MSVQWSSFSERRTSLGKTFGAEWQLCHPRQQEANLCPGHQIPPPKDVFHSPFLQYPIFFHFSLKFILIFQRLETMPYGTLAVKLMNVRLYLIDQQNNIENEEIWLISFTMIWLIFFTMVQKQFKEGWIVFPTNCVGTKCKLKWTSHHIWKLIQNGSHRLKWKTKL